MPNIQFPTKYPMSNIKKFWYCNIKNFIGIWDLGFGNSSRMCGQGLLEAVIALGIIITGLVAALTLAIGSLSGAGASESRIIAVNLAREGMEITRNRRDS